MTVETYYVNGSGILVPFRATSPEEPPPPPPPPPPDTARQLIGWAHAVSGASWTGAAGNLTNEEARLASLFGWPAGGPPVMRLYRQQQSPPFSDMQRTITDGRIPWVSCKPGAGGLAGDLAGGSDARWTAWGNYCRGFWPNQIIFTYDHEVDRHAYSGAAAYSNLQYRNYQTDFVEVFRNIKDLMIATDPTHSLDNVVFASNFTGWSFRPGSNRDPGLAWHPDIDMVSVDPYDFFLFNDGTREATRRHLFANYGGFSTGAAEHYMWSTDPQQWYDDMHPTWDVPATILANLDKFPVRMAIGETGFQFSMHPNGTNTQWIHEEDRNDPDNSQGLQIKQLGLDLRTNYPRHEVVIYWASSTNSIGASVGSPNYFQGPAVNRWDHQSNGSIEAMRRETSRLNHQGALTPWGPGGLL